MRSLATPDGRYSNAQVDAKYLSSTGVLSCHFDVLDKAGNLTPIKLEQLKTANGDFTNNPNPGGVLSASVGFDNSQQIRKSLTLKMIAQPQLMHVPFQYFIRPWLDIGPMPDGGTASLPMGTYVWVTPSRTLGDIGPLVNADIWDVTLGDRQHLLDARGVDGNGLVYLQGEPIQWALQNVLSQIGVTDFSKIQPSTAVFAGNVYFELTTGDTAAAFGSPWAAYVAAAYAAAAHVGVAGDYTITNSSTPETLAKICDYLHATMGYDPGFFNLEDQWTAAPPAAPGAAPGVTYTAEYVAPNAAPALPGSRVNLVLGTPQIAPDLTKIANLIVVRSSNGSSNQSNWTAASLDQYFPNHPMCISKIGFAIQQTIEDPSSEGYAQMLGEAYAALVASALNYETLTLDTFAYPAHEGNELVAVRIPNDPDYAAGQTCKETAWTLDLISGRMSHTLKRIFA